MLIFTGSIDSFIKNKNTKAKEDSTNTKVRRTRFYCSDAFTIGLETKINTCEWKWCLKVFIDVSKEFIDFHIVGKLGR